MPEDPAFECNRAAEDDRARTVFLCAYERAVLGTTSDTHGLRPGERLLILLHLRGGRDMRQLFKLAFCAATMAAASGCAASGYCDAAEQLRTTNPHAAIEYVSLSLAANPDYERAIDLISDLGSRLRDDHQTKIDELERSQSWEDCVAQCDRMIASAELVAKLPHGIQIFHPADHRARYAKFAAKKFYDQGVKLEGDSHLKEAAVSYRRALGFVTNYQDALVRYERVQKGATVKVAVVGFDSAVPGGQSLTQLMASRTLASCVAKNPEFLVLVSGDKLDASCQGKLTGTVTAATFDDSSWVPHPGRNETTTYETQNGRSVELKHLCTWTIFERKTHYVFAASFKVDGTQNGNSMSAGSSTKEVSDSKTYIQVSGDEQALPDELKQLPRGPSEPKGERQLSEECANLVADDLGLQLFTSFK
jgi:hypothetical protein